MTAGYIQPSNLSSALMKWGEEEEENYVLKSLIDNFYGSYVKVVKS